MTLTTEAKTYPALLVEVEPKVIETEEDYDRMLAIAQELLFNKSKSPAEVQLLKLVVTLIETYEEKHYPMPEVSPDRIFRHFIEVGASTQTELASLIGTTPEEMAQFVSGEKVVDEVQAAILGDRFKVSPTLFR